MDRNSSFVTVFTLMGDMLSINFIVDGFDLRAGKSESMSSMRSDGSISASSFIGLCGLKDDDPEVTRSLEFATVLFGRSFFVRCVKEDLGFSSHPSRPPDFLFVPAFEGVFV